MRISDWSSDVCSSDLYQFGRARTGTAATAPEQDVSAYFVHAEIGHQFDIAWKPRVSIEYDRASGDRAGGGFGRFDSLYGVRRPDYGPRSAEQTSELQSLMRISSAVF